MSNGVPESAHAQKISPATTHASTSPLSGAVPAQYPARSYAKATNTATPTPSTPAGASVPAQDAKSATDLPVNGANSSMAQGGSQAATNVANGSASHEHGRKPSMVINASGASGYTPNGGPVSQNGRPSINFGSINSQGSPMPAASVPHPAQPPASLPTPSRDPRPTSPAHTPSPIPQPAASGGRPPSGLQNQNNGMTFGSMGADGQQSGQMQPGAMGPGIPMHERRQSSQSMLPGGRGRGYPGQPPYGMASPGQAYRQLPAQGRNPSNMPPQFQPQMQPGSPYGRGRNSPAVNHSQPNMPPQHMAGAQMPYGYPQHVGPQHQGMYNMPHYDPSGGYYPPYYPGYAQYPGQPAPPSPHRYPTPFNGQQGPMQPPFHPPSMSRSTSQASERPSSSMGQSSTPSMQQSHPASQATASQPGSTPSTSFVKPSQKKSSAIKITDAQGNPLDFNKPKPTPSPSNQSQQSAPLIVGAPSTSTPPPRVPSGQHVRAESKSTKSAEDTRNTFLEQVRRKQEEEKRKEEEAAKAKQQVEDPSAGSQKAQDEADAAAKQPVKVAIAEAEKAAAVDAGDKEGEKLAEVAVSAATKDDGEKTEREETEDERLDRMIAEMEAAERAEEEREKAYAEKQKKEKEEKAKLAAQDSAKQDEDLKRQEREAEEREAQRERERESDDKGKDKDKPDTDQESKDLFSALKKPTLGPGASATESGADTPASEDTDSSAMPPPAQSAAASQSRPVGAPKPKPAHLKLETAKRVESAEPTPGMQALKSARFLEIKDQAKLTYPGDFKSPNPALNVGGHAKARSYDKQFLMQFQNVFKEKPSVDWDQKVKETLGPSDEPGSGRPQSARTPSTAMGGRSASGRPPAAMGFGAPMGQFSGPQGRTLPPGTTSQDRFMASQAGSRNSIGGMPGGMGRIPSQIGIAAGMARTNSLQAIPGMIQSPGRQQSGRGPKAGSRRGDRTMSKKEESEQNSKMPLTAHMELTPLERSSTGWKASSIGQPMAAGPDPSGNMAPDMVQRKVKAALNKMTPEKFDKIADQILEIAAQSKNESDGRTLRQVIQLTFEKACDEAHWAGMYAQFCHKMLTSMSSEIRDETIKDKNGNAVVGGALFRKYLLNRCQEEFERGWQVNLPDKPEGDQEEAALLSDAYYTAAAAKRRGLGLIQFIGQLYKLSMLTLRIMHECVLKLLDFEGDPDEAAIENLTTLLRSVGATMDEVEQGHAFMNAYFQRIDDVLLKSDKLPSRSRFMIMDLTDLRKAGWKGKGDSKGPKTIQQIHDEAVAAQQKAEAERQRQSQRGPPGGRPAAGRGDARNFSGGMQPPVDYNRTTVNMDELRRLQNRQTSRPTGSFGPGGSLGPGSSLGMRSGSRRGAGNLGAASSGNTTRTNTPPVDGKDKKEEQSAQSNAFSALAALDPSGEAVENAPSQPEAAASSPPARNRSKSPSAEDTADGPPA